MCQKPLQFQRKYAKNLERELLLEVGCKTRKQSKRITPDTRRKFSKKQQAFAISR
jgi:galactokinase/mevalonate kinase-like predicted kinase